MNSGVQACVSSQYTCSVWTETSFFLKSFCNLDLVASKSCMLKKVGNNSLGTAETAVLSQDLVLYLDLLPEVLRLVLVRR